MSDNGSDLSALFSKISLNKEAERIQNVFALIEKWIFNFLTVSNSYIVNFEEWVRYDKIQIRYCS